MRIAIVGTGKMGRGFATALSGRHEVVLGSRQPDRAGRIVRSTGAAAVLSPAEAVLSPAEVVILAVPWQAVRETAARLGDLAGAVVVDVTVPHGTQRADLGRQSSGEAVQKLLRQARVVKGWTHVFAQHLTAPEVDGIAASVLLAGDDPDAKRIVSALARDMGFHPVDVGRLRQSYYLDQLANMMLFARLGPFRVLTTPS